MTNADFHKLLLAASTGDIQALERLRKLVEYGECIEKAFLEIKLPVVGKPLRLVKR